MMRNFRVGGVAPEDIALSWLPMIAGRDLLGVTACEFGLGQETVTLLEFADCTFEVGISEPLRPYVQMYAGADRREALDAWWDRVRFHAMLGDQPLTELAAGVEDGGGRK